MTRRSLIAIPIIGALGALAILALFGWHDYSAALHLHPAAPAVARRTALRQVGRDLNWFASLEYVWAVGVLWYILHMARREVS